jgi:hypothetical protein
MPIIKIELGPNSSDKDWAEFQRIMDMLQEEHNQYAQDLATELGVSVSCAYDICYLRSRCRHTDELEQELIELHKKGTPPNMCEFGC